MEMKHYTDFFTVPANYTANMTREAINETPETWLDFYPHKKYINFLETLFDERKSVWLTGNYGTGKSNAALVTHKLFMDDMSRVDKWFEDYRKEIQDGDILKGKLVDARNRGILVVYDYNASGIGPHEEFIVRLEKGIFAALKEQGLSAPAKANLQLVIERLWREGDNFLKTRDSILSEMKSLKSDIHSIEQLVDKLQKESISSTPTHYLEDVLTVFHRDNIYLSVDVTTFRAWIASICEANKLDRIIYIFDEFSDFIDSNSGSLKTFEEITEAPANNHFYLVPVTHKQLDAFCGENSPGANKARDRFYFRNLQMPNDIAFKLAAHAIKPIDEAKWKAEKDFLWSSIKSVVDKFNDPEGSEAYIDRQSFYNILPIHPMAAFLLKFLAESARSNQRSIFEYLKGSADGREFQEFIAKGGPSIENRQFLTVDYLWKYFMERDDSGQNKEIVDIRMEYERIKAREFVQFKDESPEIRVLKTVLLFSLLSRLNPNGHDRLRCTVENIELSFRGDGAVTNAEKILRDLADNRHCFSIADGNIDLYATTVGGDELEKKKREYSGQFYELLAEKCKSEMEAQTKIVRSKFSNRRFDIRVSDVNHTTLTNITSSTRDKYSCGCSKDDGSICLWFVVAKNKSEQMQIQEKEEKLLKNLLGHRIIMLTFPEITFCEKNINLWDEYVSLYARYLLENSNNSRNQIKKSYERIADTWTNSLRSSNVSLNIRYYDTNTNTIKCEKSSWAQLNTFLYSYTKAKMDCCPDLLAEQTTAFGNTALKAWALAGIRFNDYTRSGPQKQLIDNISRQGIFNEDSWFEANPDHMLSKIRTLLKKKYTNTVEKGTSLSIRKVYIELQRAPYGMRYNGISAFTLGFCTQWILKNNCQWTNGQLTEPLNDETLAEIIEATVSEKIKDEKFICRLSKEDKVFAERAGQMFGLPEVKNVTPSDTLRSIAAIVEKNSCKVPLWALAKYIRNTHPEHEKAAELLDKLCIALKISSKGDKEKSNVAITEIGREFLQNAGIIETVNSYTNGEIYVAAFHQYVDNADPDLLDIAENIEDQSHYYCDLILNKAANSAGWLWNPADITSLIEEVHYSYSFIELARKFLNLSGYISYDAVLSRVEEKISSAGLPYSLVCGKYNYVAQLIDELNGNRNAKVLSEALRNSIDILNELYNDPQKKLAIAMIRERIGNVKIGDEDFVDILSGMSSLAEYSANLSVEEYLTLFRNQINKNVRNVIIGKIEREWKRISGFDVLSDWPYQTKLPVWTVFDDVDNGRELIQLLRAPRDFSNDALEQKLAILENLPTVSVKKCQNAFLQKVVPEKYKKLDINLASLLKYLGDQYGKDPEKWPEHPDINGFVKEYYQDIFAPEILSNLRRENAETLKEKLLNLVNIDPDIGLRFMEL